jgi:hypothetical protein
MVLTMQCNVIFCLWQLYATPIQEDRIFEGKLLNFMLNLICEGLAEDYTAKQAKISLGLPGGLLAKNLSILAMLLRQYQSHWHKHDGLLYY